MNKREFFRLDIIVSFYYKLIKREDQTDYSFEAMNAGRVVNLSGNGLVFYPVEENDELPDNSLVFGRINMIQIEEDIPVLCRKVRTLKQDMNGKTIDLFALHILEIQTKHQDKIVELLNKELLY